MHLLTCSLRQEGDVCTCRSHGMWRGFLPSIPVYFLVRSILLNLFIVATIISCWGIPHLHQNYSNHFSTWCSVSNLFIAHTNTQEEKGENKLKSLESVLC